MQFDPDCLRHPARKPILAADSKQAVSAGTFEGIVPLFWSPETLEPRRPTFKPPVSVSENSVPRGTVSMANAARCRQIF